MRPGRVDEAFGLYGGGVGSPSIANPNAAGAGADALGEMGTAVAAGMQKGLDYAERELQANEERRRRADAAQFYDLQTDLEVERRDFEAEEEGLNGAPGRAERWKRYVEKRVAPKFSRMKWETADVSRQARGYYDRIVKLGAVADVKADRQSAVDREKRALRSRLEVLSSTGRVDEANELVDKNVGNLLLPEEGEKVKMDLRKIGIASSMKALMAENPVKARAELDALEGRMRENPEATGADDWDLLVRLRSENEREVRRRQADRLNEYSLELYEGRPLDRKKLDEDVASGAMDVDQARELKAYEERRNELVAKKGKEAVKSYNDAADYMRVTGLLKGYRPEEDVDGQRFAEVERAIGTAMLSEWTRAELKKELTDVYAGKVPERLRGVSGFVEGKVDDMLEQQRVVKFKDDDGNVDVAKFDEAMALGYDVKCGMREWLRQNPQATREEAEKEVYRRMSAVPVNPRGTAGKTRPDLGVGTVPIGGGVNSAPEPDYVKDVDVSAGVMGEVNGGGQLTPEHEAGLRGADAGLLPPLDVVQEFVDGMDVTGMSYDDARRRAVRELGLSSVEDLIRLGHLLMVKFKGAK